MTFRGERPATRQGSLFPALCLGHLVCEMGVITVPTMGIFLSKEQVALKVCHDKGQPVYGNA